MTNNKMPTIRQTNWIAIIPQVIFMLCLTQIFKLLNFETPIIWGCITYILFSFSLRSIFIKDHNKGIKLTKQNNFVDAIPYFEKSIEYFGKNNWIDRYRFITLLSSSNISYREMGLNNIAFCYSQIGNGLKSKEYYEKMLLEFPNSILAKSALNFFEAAKNNEQS
ncbi:hypothetical protein [Chishuiella changwenlii]|uniref:tetratricopeptide repeat protein n=1 Tax=Chishuiella changwenlii TaxID=1434701 RepID=UPI002FDB3324